jgi:hypothetical protein
MTRTKPYYLKNIQTPDDYPIKIICLQKRRINVYKILFCEMILIFSQLIPSFPKFDSIVLI